jgi:hypothetical protein
MDNGNSEAPKDENTVTCKNKGGRKGWATVEQDTWLRKQVSAFTAAQINGARGLAQFWPPLWEEWFTRWPETALPAEDVEDASEASAKQLERQKAQSKIVLTKKMVSAKFTSNRV